MEITELGIPGKRDDHRSKNRNSTWGRWTSD